MLNLYMNNRGATKGQRGDDKSYFVYHPEKASRFPEIFKFNSFND